MIYMIASRSVQTSEATLVMSPTRTSRLLDWIKTAIAAGPWILSMYALYYAEKYQVWIPETPYRDKITIVVLVLGLGLSFFLKSYFTAKKGR